MQTRNLITPEEEQEKSLKFRSFKTATRGVRINTFPSDVYFTQQSAE